MKFLYIGSKSKILASRRAREGSFTVVVDANMGVEGIAHIIRVLEIAKLATAALSDDGSAVPVLSQSSQPKSRHGITNRTGEMK